MKNLIKKYLGINYIIENAKYQEEIIGKLKEASHELRQALKYEIRQVWENLDVTNTNLNDLESKVDEIEGNVDENRDNIVEAISLGEELEGENYDLRDLFNELQDKVDELGS